MAGEGNGTTTIRFILLGFLSVPELQVFFFVMFLGIYLIAIAGNLGLFTLIRSGDPHLHTPMYFFLSNLAFTDICYSSTITPKMLSDFFRKEKTISFLGCATQFFVFASLGGGECLLLSAMAYDRYAAICNPLLYTAVMSPRLCGQMVAGAFMGGFLASSIQTYFVFQLHFCGSNIINHFFCDLPPLLALSCSDTFYCQVANISLTTTIGVTSVLVILVSYGYIADAILKIRSAQGRSKAFNTCASHLTAVTLLYGSILFTYLRPSSSYSLNQDKVVSVLYSLVNPMLNPLIYSLRNKEIKDALRRVREKTRSFSLPYLS
ncbi:olfactory receptor 5A1-like [Ornithorhynchus anatinus]|uniref:olfactory receptor 5A1-like n=1 Tax=Ornithorhynchus anatinus TaxID=9258 RepID=UPI0002240813|nr:olfactory receptor 5A1-like [Ornithorhynchus anatinus]